MHKFKAHDQKYFDSRKQFAQKYQDIERWFWADNWPLFAGEVNIARTFSIYELIKKVIDLPGHFCELGCWNGTNLVFMAKVLNILKPQSYTQVIGFDSFEGLQVFDSYYDENNAKTKGNFKGSVVLLEDILKLHNLHDFVQLVKGDIEKTLPEFLKQRRDIRFSFIYFDTDLYSSTKIGIELLYEKLLKGGIMVFDEYNYEDWPGETSALHEVLGDNISLHSVPFTRQPIAYHIK